LVLSGGGLFGAWQVGAWSVLRKHCRFDLIVGASIGSLNGWAIAGGATPEELEARWMNVAASGRLRFRIPWRPLDGVVDFSLLEGFIREIHSSYRPQVEFQVAVTELTRLKPRLVEGSHVQWRHLAASCALLGLLPQQRIDRILYTDGGLLGALPLWGARQCQATHIIGLNVMPRMPWPVRAVLKPLAARRRSDAASNREGCVVLSPAEPLGHWRRGLSFHPGRIGEWIGQGRRDTEAAIASGNIPLLKCFVPE
jgi:predicted acylesterase/phospholipase RssA